MAPPRAARPGTCYRGGMQPPIAFDPVPVRRRWAAWGCLLLLAGCGATASPPVADGATQPPPADGQTVTPPDAAVEDAGADDAAIEACVAPITWQDDIGPLLDQYCGGACHAGGEEWATCAKSQKKATTIKNYLKNKLMPPAGSPSPDETERQLLYDWIATGKTCASPCP